MKPLRKICTIFVLACLLCGLFVSEIHVIPTEKVFAATTVKFNKKTYTVKVGKKVTLVLKDAKGKKINPAKATWTSKNKKLAKVSKKGVVTGVKAGTTKVTAKYKGKKYTCTVIVKAGNSLPDDVKNDPELMRAVNAGLVGVDLLKTPDRAITFEEYQTMLTKLVKKCNPQKVSQYQSYFLSHTKGHKLSYYELAALTGLAAYAAGPATLTYDGNIWNYIDRQEWDNMPSAYLYENVAFDWDHTDLNNVYLWINHEKMEWGMDGVGLNYCLFAFSPYSGKHIIDYYGKGLDLSFLADTCTVREASQAIVRAYDDLTYSFYDDSGDQSAAEIRKQAKERKNAILNSKTEVVCTGTAYYVSNAGDDANTGKSENEPWASLEKVNSANLSSGDVVYFRRGDTWRGILKCKDAVTYSAYGTGNKPIFKMSEEGADPDRWTLYKTRSDGGKIWKYYKGTEPAGSIFMNDYTVHANKYFARYVDGKYYTLDDKDTLFIPEKHLENLQFFTMGDSHQVDFMDEEYDGKDKEILYFRCDAGNPGEVYHNIEIGRSEFCIYAGNKTMIDNLCIYGGQTALCTYHSRADDVTFQNCEVAYQGGIAVFYDDGGMPVPGGDGITLVGDRNVARNNYIHDTWDHGITWEVINAIESFDGGEASGNLISNCEGGILMVGWFHQDSETVRYKNLKISDNYVMYCGYGWSYDAHPNTGPWEGSSAFTNGGNFNYTRIENIVLENNIFYLSTGSLIAFPLRQGEKPVMRGNTYVQGGGLFAEVYDSKKKWAYFLGGDDISAVKEALGDETGKFIVLAR
ncbi:MAG: Ig-like domain-containing protein [Thermoflexaceae bacterium]|nr:Ig-like domain-containing protein [Thermoflexaceae bacterium]